MEEMLSNQVIPAAISFQNVVLANINAMKAAGLEAMPLKRRCTSCAAFSEEIGKAHASVHKLQGMLNKAHR